MKTPEQAVIVAAGQSSRLYPLTLETPKSLLAVGKESLIQRSVRLLRQSGVKEVIIVNGFQRNKIESHLGKEGIRYLYNPYYKFCNNMGSLWFAKNNLKGDFLYLHSDVIYSESHLPRLLSAWQDSRWGCLLVDPKPCDAEAMKVKLDTQGRYLCSSKDIPLNESSGEWTGLAAFRQEYTEKLFNKIEDLLQAEHYQSYDTVAFNDLAKMGIYLDIVSTEQDPWLEIDFKEDLQRAQNIFGQSR